MDKLIDYLFFVGPGRGSVYRRSPSLKRGSSSQNGGPVESITSWHKISRPVPTILCQFPLQQENSKSCLLHDVAYFCQPEGPCVQLSEPKMHIFMLTDTETNVQTYGMCLSIPHLFDPLLKAQAPSSSVKKSAVWEVNDCESVCIQEWGVLSICILTRHPFYHFFAKCLKTLSHFVDHFGGKELNWNAIIQAQISAAKNILTQNGTNGLPKGGIVREVQDWIERLVALKAPSANVNVLELELEVDPAVMVCYPPPNRLPLFDLQVHKLFQKLEVCFVIDIYKLVLSEEKVILHSHDVAFVSECVLTMVTLLYPLQYLFPVIPLLPTSMPTAENLLMVPTPFFVGVCTSFMKKVNEVHRSETWIVDLDNKEIRAPSLPDKPPLEFPFSILQLQADIRRAMDKLDPQNEPKEDETKLTSQKSSTDKSFPKGVPPSNHTPNSAHTATTATANGVSSLLAHLSDGVIGSELEDDVDVMIRISFIEFLFCSEILGLIERHVCVFRLFPRPVVTLKQVAFLSAYEKVCSNTDKTFIKELILSQCVEYFQEWSLNPPNYSFDEIKKGTKELERLSDKQQYYVHRMGVRTDQACLYNASSESLLYQEMLSYKASQASSFSVVTEGGLDDDSDWELLPDGDYYDGASESSTGGTSPYPFYTDSYPRSPYVLDTSRGSAHYDSSEADEDSDILMDGKIRIRGTAVVQNSDDEIEIEFHSRGGTVNPPTLSGVGRQQSPSVHYEETNSPRDKPAARSGVKGQPDGGGRTRQQRRRRGSGKRRKTTTGASSRPIKTTPSSDPTTPSRRVSSSVPNNLVGFTRHFPLDDGGTGPIGGGGGYFPSPRRIDEEIDIIPPSSSDEEEEADSGAALSPRGGRVRRPLWRYNFETPLLHVPPLSGSSSSMEFNTPTTSTTLVAKTTTSEVGGASSGGGSKNSRLREEEVDGLFTVGSLGLSSTAGQMQTSRTLENQIQDLVTKITEGQGLPWPKPAHLKRLAGYEKTRVMLLRELEVKLGVRRPDEFVMASDPQIAHVATTRAVFKGLQDLLKYLLQCVEEELQRESEAAIFSVFLILRLAFSIHLPPPPTKPKAGGGGGGLSFFSALFGSDEDRSRPRAVEMESVVVGKSVDEYDGGRGKIEAERKEKAKENGTVKVKDVVRETSFEEDRALKGVFEGNHREKQAPSSLLDDGERAHESLHRPETIGPLINLTPTNRDDVPVRTIGSPSSAFTPLVGLDSRLPSVHPVATPPSSLATPPTSLATPTISGQLRPVPPNLANGEDQPDLGGRRVSLGLEKGSPLRKGRAVSPSHQLLLDLLESPRIYRPRDEVDCRLSGCVFLYKEVMKSLGSAKSFLLEKKFWDVLFMSTVSTDRNLLGWNEKTTELYTRYNTLHEDDRREFGLEEDNLLSIILHDLLVFMLMVGMRQEETAMLIHRFAARIRLATSEEKLLQQTLKYIENNASNELDLSSIGLLTLYSEVHPTISYIVHYGISVVAPVYKLQLTSEALILRRFPDEGITTRLWNDHVTEVECNQHRSTVTVRYKDLYGEYNHHFHTKQFANVCDSLMKLIPQLSLSE